MAIHSIKEEKRLKRNQMVKMSPVFYTHAHTHERHLSKVHSHIFTIFTIHNHLPKRFKNKQTKNYIQIRGLQTHLLSAEHIILQTKHHAMQDNETDLWNSLVHQPFISILESAIVTICGHLQRSFKNILILCRKEHCADWKRIGKML